MLTSGDGRLEVLVFARGSVGAFLPVELVGTHLDPRIDLTTVRQRLQATLDQVLELRVESIRSEA